MSEISIGTETISFDTGLVQSKAGFITETTVIVDRNDTSVQNPNQDVMTTFQDTGIGGITVTLAGLINGGKSSVNSIREKLRRFQLMDQVDDTKPHGVVSYEIDEYPEWNLNASADRGGVILHAESKRSNESPTKIEFIMIIRVNGIRGASPYRWN